MISISGKNIEEGTEVSGIDFHIGAQTKKQRERGAWKPLDTGISYDFKIVNSKIYYKKTSEYKYEEISIHNKNLTTDLVRYFKLIAMSYLYDKSVWLNDYEKYLVLKQRYEVNDLNNYQSEITHDFDLI